MSFNHYVKVVAMLAAAFVFAMALDAAPEDVSKTRPSALDRFRARRANEARSVRPADENAANAPSATAATEDAESKEAPALNWDATPADIVLQSYAEQVNKTVLTDPATPKATITLKSREGQKLTKEEYLEAIEIILEMNGIHLEPYGDKFIRALPRKDVRKEGIPLYMDPEKHAVGESGKVISMMIPFKNIATDEAQKALEGFKSGSGILLVFERTNSILATDTEQNIKRMLEIAKTIDVASPVLENVFVRQIKNASAADIKTALEAIVQESQKEQEKNGKNVNNNASQPQTSPFPRPGGLLHRTGQSQSSQPVNNASLVMSVSDADRGMIRGKVLILADERSNKLVIVTQKPNMDFFDKVIEQLDIETTPDTVVKVYRLKYAEAEEVSDMINDLIGNASSSKSSSKNNQNQNAKSGSGGNITHSATAMNASRKSANQRTGEAKAGELSKDNTTVLADKRINGLVVMTNKELVPVVEQIIESMDVKLSQVLIETCIIEVTLGNGIKTGIDWVQNGRYQEDGSWTTQTKTGAHGLPMYWYKNGDDWKQAEEGSAGSGWEQVGDALTEKVWTAGELTKDGLITGSSGYAQLFGGGANSGASAAAIVEGTALATNVFSSALNYVFKSDKLNLSAIIQATKSDNRAKYIASPIVMTVDNKEATIEATTARKFLSNYQTSSSYYGSTPAPQYESKDIGIKIKVKPKINPNGAVMLNVEEEYSQVGAKQQILDPNSKSVDIDTALTRKMSADALLENGQTVVLCGLTETQTQDSLTGIPILMDIPWIGKWLFSKVSQEENRAEVLIFMTPYVLNDGESAQAEALRRKKALSDPRPWEDHGWSLSELADPVTKKEQMRRLKDEWKKQDEERKTKLAIEEAKLERAKALEKMTEDERNFWLEQHKEDLKEEEKEELEKKMLDKDSQDALKKLAEEVRERKLKEANAEIKKADDAAKLENERAKLDAAKAAEAEEAETSKPVEPEPKMAEDEKTAVEDDK